MSGILKWICILALFLSSGIVRCDNLREVESFSSVLSRVSALSPGERVAEWSAWILRSPESATTELARLPSAVVLRDNVPLFPARFDCTTYVESVLALARSSRAEDVVPRLVEIRYRDGEATYLARRHFPEAEWVPGNIRAGVLEDVTEQLARREGLSLSRERKKIARGAWIARKVKAGAAPKGIAFDPRETIDAELPVIAATDAPRALEGVKTGWIVDFVRKNEPGHRLMITHQGFLIRKGKRWILRHAALSHGVRESEFLPYLRVGMSQPWPVTGLHFTRIRTQIEQRP